MNAIILESGSPPGCQPICSTRPLAACRVGATTLRSAQAERLVAAGLTVAATAAGGALALWVAGDSWLAPELCERLRRTTAPGLVLDSTDAPLAWVNTSRSVPEGALAVSPGDAAWRIRYAWDLLRIHEELMAAMAADRIEGDVCPAAHVEGRLILGRGSRLLPGVYVEGNVCIGADTKVGPNAYLRGGTTIGDRCHIGQAVEIKNSIVYDETSIGHLSYCGDSIVGAQANFGAGTITANFRHDGHPHRSMAGGQLLDTGRRKFGAIVGDGVHTGIHTSIYPGRKLWPGVCTRPGAVVDRDIGPP